MSDLEYMEQVYVIVDEKGPISKREIIDEIEPREVCNECGVVQNSPERSEVSDAVTTCLMRLWDHNRITTTLDWDWKTVGED